MSKKLPVDDKELTAEDQSYYDADYFVNGAKKIKDENTGEEKVWGYQGTDWAGHFHIVNGILRILQGEVGSILDVGAGQGSFTDYALRVGLNAKGYDFSEWAVANPINLAKGHLFQGSATEIKEEDDSYDVLYCSDMLEHIKQSESSKVIAEFKRVSAKWVFLQFPVADENTRFNFEVDGKDHFMYASYMLAGHMNMETRSWWDTLFKSHGFKIRDDLVEEFRKYTPPDVLTNWFNIVVLEK